MNADEWSFPIRSCARVTVFTGDGNTGTLGYQPRDVPRSFGQYVESIWDEEVEMLEVFCAPKHENFPLKHLNLQDNEDSRRWKFMKALRKRSEEESVKPAK